MYSLKLGVKGLNEHLARGGWVLFKERSQGFLREGPIMLPDKFIHREYMHFFPVRAARKDFVGTKVHTAHNFTLLSFWGSLVNTSQANTW